MKKANVYNWAHTALWLIATGAACLIFALNVVFSADVAQNSSEKVSFYIQLLPNGGMLLIAALLFANARVFRKELRRIRMTEKTLFFLCTGVYSLIALYLILNIGTQLRADAKDVWEIAKQYNPTANPGPFFKGGYIYMYPHQLGLLTFDRLLQLFSQNAKIFFTVNFLCVITINFLLYKTADLVFENHTVNLMTILFSFLFIPNLLFITFAYSMHIGLVFMLAAFYFTLKLRKTGKWYHLLLTALFSALAVMIKTNYLIGIIAIALYWVLCFLQHRQYRALIVIAAVLVCAILPQKILTRCYEHDTNASLTNGAPSVLWVVMGTDIDNHDRGPGWYNTYNFNTFYNSATTEEAAEKGKESLAKNIEKIQNNPAKALQFLLDKTVSQWCEPLYQSDWSGPLPDTQQEINTDLLRDFYGGGKSNLAISIFAKCLMLVLWALSAVFMVFYAKKHTGWEISLMFFIGGLLFHTVWEGKSQYIMPYVLVLIPFAMYAAYRLLTRQPKKAKTARSVLTDYEGNPLVMR